ncbi:hypothetical protein GPJ61_15920 [Brevibacillus formosus]|uniref:hypothetical protein n=1 Tax=Brevibacillus formosus TaxID=54913 RepID=UPI001CA55C5C|nr:hypothetical protein [Brevibacillus formosus]MBW5469347.1 hypothetical protein [Brevibacillus formosus]
MRTQRQNYGCEVAFVVAGAGADGFGAWSSSEKNGMITRLSTKNKIQAMPLLKMQGVSIG